MVSKILAVFDRVLVPCSNTLRLRILLNRIGLSRHRGLISLDILSLDDEPIARDVHSLFDFHDVADNKLGAVEQNLLAAADNRYLEYG